MDLNDVRTLWTVLSFAAFLGIVFWAYSGKRKARFDEAARLALDDDAGDPAAGTGDIGTPGRTRIPGEQEPRVNKNQGQGRAT